VDDGEGAVGHAVVAQEGLFGDAVLAHRHRRGAGAHRDELGQVVQRGGRDVLELGGHRGTAFGQGIEGVEVVVAGLQVTVGDEAGGAVGVRVEHPDLVAHLVGCGDEEAAELAAAEHAKGGGRENHRVSPAKSDRNQTGSRVIASTLAVWSARKASSF
jgi:hypothetical protein